MDTRTCWTGNNWFLKVSKGNYIILLSLSEWWQKTTLLWQHCFRRKRPAGRVGCPRIIRLQWIFKTELGPIWLFRMWPSQSWCVLRTFTGTLSSVTWSWSRAWCWWSSCVRSWRTLATASDRGTRRQDPSRSSSCSVLISTPCRSQESSSLSRMAECQQIIPTWRWTFNLSILQMYWCAMWLKCVL